MWREKVLSSRAREKEKNVSWCKWFVLFTLLCNALVVRAIFVLFYVLFLFVDASIQSTELEEDSKYGKFRLKVKRRLLKSNPELKNLSKKEMQEELVRLYEDEMVRFRSIEKVAYERLRILIARVVTTE